MNKTDEFAEIIAGHFYDILRAAGVSMTPVNAHEKIRLTSKKLAKSIEHRAEQKSIEIIKELQPSIKEGFEAVEEDVNQLKAQIDKIEQLIIFTTNLLPKETKPKTDLDLIERDRKLKNESST